MKIRKLANMPYAQAKIYEYRVKDGDNGNYDILVSYKTSVVQILYDKHAVICTGTYSRTTSKHISSFMREKSMSYFIAKQCHLKDQYYNFVTKEFNPIEEIMEAK